MASQVLTKPMAVKTLKYTFDKIEAAVDAGMRAAIEVEAIPKLQQKAQASTQQPRQAPDGKFYVPDPQRPGKYLRVDQ